MARSYKTQPFHGLSRTSDSDRYGKQVSARAMRRAERTALSQVSGRTYLGEDEESRLDTLNFSLPMKGWEVFSSYDMPKGGKNIAPRLSRRCVSNILDTMCYAWCLFLLSYFHCAI